MELPFSLETYVERVGRSRSSLEESGLDAIVVTLPDSINWVSGYDTIGYLWPQALLIDRREGDPVLHTRTTEEPGFHATSWLSKGVFYDIAVEDWASVLSDTLNERDLAQGRIGIELNGFTLPAAQLDRLREAMPGVEWVDATELIPELRLVKSEAELVYQRQAAEMADFALGRAFESLRPGIAETEVAGIAAAALGEAGSEYAAIPPMVVSGSRSALVHGMARRRALGMGDVVCVELGASVHRYHAIVMRTAVIGRPSDRVAEVADCLERAFEAAVSACEPGVAAHVPDDRCNAVLDELDLSRRRCHRLGYSLGIAYPPGWLEPMTLVAGDRHSLAAGMSFSIEPNLTLPDEGFGMKLGDTVECTADGARSLSRRDHRVFVVE